MLWGASVQLLCRCIVIFIVQGQGVLVHLLVQAPKVCLDMCRKCTRDVFVSCSINPEVCLDQQL